MGRKAQTERRTNGIADMFTPLVMARLEREKEQKKREKSGRDAKAKRDKRQLLKLAGSLPNESFK